MYRPKDARCECGHTSDNHGGRTGSGACHECGYCSRFKGAKAALGGQRACPTCGRLCAVKRDGRLYRHGAHKKQVVINGQLVVYTAWCREP